MMTLTFSPSSLEGWSNKQPDGSIKIKNNNNTEAQYKCPRMNPHYHKNKIQDKENCISDIILGFALTPPFCSGFHPGSPWCLFLCPLGFLLDGMLCHIVLSSEDLDSHRQWWSGVWWDASQRGVLLLSQSAQAPWPRFPAMGIDLGPVARVAFSGFSLGVTDFPFLLHTAVWEQVTSIPHWKDKELCGLFSISLTCFSLIYLHPYGLLKKYFWLYSKSTFVFLCYSFPGLGLEALSASSCVFGKQPRFWVLFCSDFGFLSNSLLFGKYKYLSHIFPTLILQAAIISSMSPDSFYWNCIRNQLLGTRNAWEAVFFFFFLLSDVYLSPMRWANSSCREIHTKGRYDSVVSQSKWSIRTCLLWVFASYHLHVLPWYSSIHEIQKADAMDICF